MTTRSPSASEGESSWDHRREEDDSPSNDFQLQDTLDPSPEEPIEHQQAVANQFDEATDTQVRYLLRFAGVIVMLVVGYFVWSDVAPALSVLDRVELWSKNVEVVEEVVGAF